MTPMPRRFIILTITTAVLVVSAPTWAHTSLDVVPAPSAPPSTATWHAAPTPPALPWLGFAVVALVAAALARRPRHAVALALVLVLLLFAFEAGVHSVHHLNNRDAGATCVVASGSSHVAGTPVDGGSGASLILVLLERLVFDSQPNVEVRSVAVHQGRAPPLSA
jgi:hypothetical protein